MGSFRSDAETFAGVLKTPTNVHDRGSKTRTKYIKSVKAPDTTRCFKPGQNNKKIGGPVVTKGHWRGYPVFTLTLEERSTCPPHCEQWMNAMATTCHSGTASITSTRCFTKSWRMNLTRSTTHTRMAMSFARTFSVTFLMNRTCVGGACKCGIALPFMAGALLTTVALASSAYLLMNSSTVNELMSASRTTR